MLENKIIGISGVFVLTFCLIALYHLIGKLGPHGKRYDGWTKQVNKHDQDRRPHRDARKASGKDNAWLLWSPELDAWAGPPRRGFGKQRETNDATLPS